MTIMGITHCPSSHCHYDDVPPLCFFADDILMKQEKRSACTDATFESRISGKQKLSEITLTLTVKKKNKRLCIRRSGLSAHYYCHIHSSSHNVTNIRRYQINTPIKYDCTSMMKSEQTIFSHNFSSPPFHTHLVSTLLAR